jgi:hypothetical protein
MMVLNSLACHALLVVQAEEGALLTEEEYKLAIGAFDPHKYEEYNRQVSKMFPELLPFFKWLLGQTRKWPFMLGCVHVHEGPSVLIPS